MRGLGLCRNKITGEPDVARDQLLGLAADVDRLLAAGATAASGNENLSRRGKSLRNLGEKVAALKPVADAVGKVLEAPAKQIGHAFLDLLTMARQLRTSLSSVGVEGTLAPVSASGPWHTPLHVRDLTPLHGCLAGSGSGREEVLKDAIQRKATADLRLLSPLLDAIEDNYAPLSDLVTEQALPALGVGVLPEVETRLKITDGKIPDARRLGLICKLNPERGLELCRQAIKTGSIALRVKALELLPDISHKDEAEKTGLELYQDKSAEVRVAAILALRHAKSKEALAAILAAASDRSTQVRNAIVKTLTEMPNPETTPRLLLRIRESVEQLDQLKPEKKEKPPKGKKTTGKKAAATSKTDAAFYKKKGELIQEATFWLAIVEYRKGAGREEAARAILPLLDHKEGSVREGALAALGGIGAVIEGVIDRFIDKLKDKKPKVAGSAAFSLRKMEPTLREPAMPTVLELLEKPKLDETLRGGLLHLLPGHLATHGDRILSILRKEFASKNHYRRSTVLNVLCEIGPPAADLVPDVVEGMSSGGGYYNYLQYPNCLTKLDPEGVQAVPGLIKLLDDKKHEVRWRAVCTLQTYGLKAKAAIPAIRALIDREKKDAYYHFAEGALKAIEEG